MSFVESFIARCQALLTQLNPADVDRVANEIAAIRSREGRLSSLARAAVPVMLLMRPVTFARSAM